jgi:choline dehydrogenase
MLPMHLASEPNPAALQSRHTNCTIRFGEEHGGQPQDLMIIALNMNVLSHLVATLDANVGSVCVWLNETHSRGRLELKSADPDAAPVVRERMLSDERDLLRMREGVDVLVDLMRRPELTRIRRCQLTDLVPDFWEALDSGTRDLDRYLLDHVVDGQHPTSTCRMGLPDDPATVVDSDCRVLGVEGLRVVDASVLPTVPRANTNLVTIMAGELMADRIAVEA